MMRLKTKKSAGVPVTPAVHRMIARGSAARDRKDWAASAANYRLALAAEPSLAHIWVQLGHALKEQGLRQDAKHAYARALDVQPSHSDAALHLGHLASDDGDHASALRYFLRLIREAPRSFKDHGALDRALLYASARQRAEAIALLRITLDDEPVERDEAAGPGGMIFDASDLIMYFQHARLPTGIQRVQIEAITAAIDRAGGARICCLLQAAEHWAEVPIAAFRELAALSTTGGDRDDQAWVTALQRLRLRLLIAPPLAFPEGACLVNLGASWQLHNYFLHVRDAKHQSGIRYVPFVHDMIPLALPHYFTRDLTSEFADWASGVLRHADGFLTCSESTKRDLLRAASTLGNALTPEQVAVVPLDADPRVSRAPIDEPPPADPYILMVSTIEPRKGHDVALDAWQALIARYGSAVPRLICVGRDGWLNARIYQRLAEDAGLAARITILSGVSDAQLAALYRGCLFTIYPSRYEGWGLPVTESLCHGKPVIASASSSLPEAGGDFAIYVEPGSAPALAGAVAELAFDAERREALASRIARDFRPRRWRDIADQIVAEASRLATRPGQAARDVLGPVVRAGAFYPVRRGVAHVLWPGSCCGEIFRAGTGWLPPNRDGSWTRPGGGQLAIPLPRDTGPLRANLLLLHAMDEDQDWELRVDQGPTLTGSLRRGAQRWVSFDVPERPDGVLRLTLSSEAHQLGEIRESASGVGVGLAGFVMTAAGDTEMRLRLLEAITFGALDDLDAFAPPRLSSAPASPQLPPG